MTVTTRRLTCLQKAQDRVFSILGTCTHIIRQEFNIELDGSLFFDRYIWTFAGLITFFIELYDHLHGRQLCKAEIAVSVGENLFQVIRSGNDRRNDHAGQRLFGNGIHHITVQDTFQLPGVGFCMKSQWEDKQEEQQFFIGAHKTVL